MNLGKSFRPTYGDEEPRLPPACLILPNLSCNSRVNFDRSAKDFQDIGIAVDPRHRCLNNPSAFCLLPVLQH